MKIKIIIIALLVQIIFTACVSINSKGIIESPYKKVGPSMGYIYKNGKNIFTSRVSTSDFVNSRIQLPGSLVASSLKIYADNSLLDFFSLEEYYEYTSNNYNKKYGAEAPVSAYILEIPQSKNYKEIVLKYSLEKLDWKLELDVSLLDESKADMFLRLRLTTNDNEFEQCQINLSLNDFRMNHNDSEFINLGNISCSKNQNLFYTLESVQSDYDLFYQWFLSTGDDVDEILTLKNTFETKFQRFDYLIAFKDLVIRDGRSAAVTDDGYFQFNLGASPELVTFRSADTTENINNKQRPFKHTLKYSVTNTGSNTKRILFYFNKMNGRTVTTEYDFKEQPDSRPGKFFLWSKELEPESLKTIDFTLDTDIKDSYEFNNYGYYSGGR